jgi:ketosteroid isomerase-like protein
MKRAIGLCVLLLSSSGAVALAKGGDADDQAKITKIMQEILDAAQKKELDRLDAFHDYGPKFTKFEDDQLARQDAVAGKKGERDALTGVKSFAAKLENLKVDVFGTAAVVTCILDYSVDTGKEKMTGKDRSTIVFAKEGGAWKIVHEHHSPLKNPS